MEWLDIGNLFIKCGEHVFAVACVLKFIDQIGSLLPYSTIENDMLCVKTEELEISLSLIYYFGNAISIVEEIERMNMPDSRLASMIETAKTGILCLRVMRGF